ncbi:MAG: ABC transporter ATP-binding protein/permease, partial [Spirochaetaceae bacterium]|nr:ABC transporter ATP-binding protein/permease [Spirochaetaceae bacterium]
MSDYFDNDDVVKEYDSKIFKRILAYIRPYKKLLFFTFAALAVSTIGELLVPVLEQRIIDDAILAKYITLNLETLEHAEASLSDEATRAVAQIQNARGARQAGNYLFVLQDQRLRVSGTVERELHRAGVLEEEQWYLFPNKNDILHIIPADFELLRGEHYDAIRVNDLAKLPKDHVKLIRKGDLSRIFNVVLFLLFALIFVFFATFVQNFCSALIGQRVMKDIRLDLFKKTISQSTSFLSRHPVGRIVTRLSGDVETINEFFTSFMVALLKDIVLMAGVLITLFVLSPSLALVIAALLPPVIICTSISRKKARDAFRRQRTAQSDVMSYLAERIAGLQIVQLFSREKKSSAEFAVRNKELLDANISEINVFATFRPIVEFLATLTTATVIAVGSNLVLDLSLSVGVLIAFINLIAMFYAPIMDISEKYTILQSAMAGGERVFTLLDTNDVIPNNGTQKIPKPVKGNIDFIDVHFSYKQGGEILKGLNFNVADGQTAAIVGYTGAGKTTIINVLSRLWDIDSGEIMLNGVNIKNIPLADLRTAILPVLQDVFLFSGTVADNIAMGLDLSFDEITAAAKAVHAHEFIENLPQGYQTILSEGAANISSGQRQLLSFARVIAHNPA